MLKRNASLRASAGDYPDTWFAKPVMAFSLSAGLLALGVAVEAQRCCNGLLREVSIA